MMRAQVAAIGFLVIDLGASGHARADWAYTHWGMTPDQVVAASNGAVKLLPATQRTRNDDDHWEIAAQGSYVDASLRLAVGFMFDTRTGGLTCALYNVTGDKDVDALASRLQQRYGNPAEDSSFGPVRTLQWSTPDEIEYAANRSPPAAAVTHCQPKAL